MTGHRYSASTGSRLYFYLLSVQWQPLQAVSTRSSYGLTFPLLLEEETVIQNIEEQALSNLQTHTTALVMVHRRDAVTAILRL